MSIPRLPHRVALPVTATTQRDQVVQGIGPQLAALYEMVRL